MLVRIVHRNMKLRCNLSFWSRALDIMTSNCPILPSSLDCTQKVEMAISISTISRPWSLAMVVSSKFPDLARSPGKSCDVERPEVDSQSVRPS